MMVSTLFGRFHRTPSPNAAPDAALDAAQIGDRVKGKNENFEIKKIVKRWLLIVRFKMDGPMENVQADIWFYCSRAEFTVSFFASLERERGRIRREPRENRKN